MKTLSAVMMMSMAVSVFGGEKVKIGLIGDSTVAVQSGWGPAFAGKFNQKAQVLNYARNGATLESLSKNLETLVSLKPDYVLIQFGHNDQKKYDPKVYSEKLKSYVEQIRKAGGRPIIFSSVVRRSFGEDGKIISNMVMNDQYSYKATLDAYAEAARSVAAETIVPFIDLYSLSEAHHNRIGREASMAYNFKEGDRTHFNRKGGEAIAALIVPELIKVAPALRGCLKADDPGEAAFSRADAAGPWHEAFLDSCTNDWTKKWFLDGEVGTVTNGQEGMTLTAGPEFKNDAHHMVLWTKESFEGDLKIEYDYTRLDNEKQCVTILYIQATGSGKPPYSTDIAEWSELRKVPSMKAYYNNMNTYHISYAAFPNSGNDRTQYIRGRRYIPNSKGLKNTDLTPDYYPEGLFKTGEKHHITVIKRGHDLYMKVENSKQVNYFHMSNPAAPPVTEGRIGLRHMYTRSALYANVKVSVIEGM